MDHDYLEEMLSLAELGRNTWLRLVEEKKISRDMIVYIIPHAGHKINDYAMQHVSELLKEKSADRLLLIISNPLEADRLSLITACEVCIVSDIEIKALIKYDDLAPFSPQVYIISFRHQADEYVNNLMGYNGITLDRLVHDVLLGIGPVAD